MDVSEYALEVKDVSEFTHRLMNNKNSRFQIIFCKKNPTLVENLKLENFKDENLEPFSLGKY